VYKKTALKSGFNVIFKMFSFVRNLPFEPRRRMFILQVVKAVKYGQKCHF